MDPDEAAGKPLQEQGIARRSVLRGLGAGALATGAGGILAACSSGIKGSQTASSTGTITLGYISPFTGPLAGFASGDRFVIDTIRATPTYSKGFKVGGRTYQVNIVVADSQSDPNRASQLARQLVLNNKVDMLLISSTPETVNPVAVVGQTQGVPCLATNDPWESWYGGLGGNPATPTASFQYCTVFFFGLKEFQGCFVPMWNRLPGKNKNVACMYPNDADGNAFRAAFEPLITDSGYWWGPYMPNKSSLDPNLTASQLVKDFQEQTGREWVQGIGSTYSLFEVAREVFTSVSDPHDKPEVARALHNVNYTGMCGPLNFSGGPAPGVAIIKPVGVQWKQVPGKFPFEMKVVDNSLNTAVPVQADLQATN
jgi:Periplasmic binding protein